MPRVYPHVALCAVFPRRVSAFEWSRQLDCSGLGFFMGQPLTPYSRCFFSSCFRPVFVNIFVVVQFSVFQPYRAGRRSISRMRKMTEEKESASEIRRDAWCVPAERQTPIVNCTVTTVLNMTYHMPTTPWIHVAGRCQGLLFCCVTFENK